MRLPSLVFWVFIMVIGIEISKTNVAVLGVFFIVAGLFMSVISLIRKPRER